jgi:predicted alpha/beta-hydrolase family hydrolase
VTEAGFEFDVDGAPSSATMYRAARAGGALALLVLAHGAGGRQNHPWMVQAARAIAAAGVDVVTFDFLYSHAGRRVPDRAPLLEATWIAALDAVRARGEVANGRLFIGGKSMGGRIATQVAARGDGGALGGLVLLGYPLHPPGRPETLRTAHLEQIREPMLFVQGTRDAFGGPEELRPFVERPPLRARIVAIEGGDHSLTPPKRAGGLAAVMARVAAEVAAFVVNPLG